MHNFISCRLRLNEHDVLCTTTYVIPPQRKEMRCPPPSRIWKELLKAAASIQGGSHTHMLLQVVLPPCVSLNVGLLLKARTEKKFQHRRKYGCILLYYKDLDENPSLSPEPFCVVCSHIWINLTCQINTVNNSYVTATNTLDGFFSIVLKWKRFLYFRTSLLSIAQQSGATFH